MPRCQRTFYYLRHSDLPAGAASAATGNALRWICPYCTDAEIYERIGEAELLQYALLAENYCKQEFGAPTDAPRPYALFYGVRPECRLELSDYRYDIYLQQGSDAFQLRLQIGHEMFHRVCSQGRVFHWTHEMLACMTAVRLLRQYASAEYADSIAQEYLKQSEKCSMGAMLHSNVTDPPYTEGIYGRAFVTGVLLQEAVGWHLLRRLARSLNKRGQVDISLWLQRLPAEVVAPALKVLKGAENPPTQNAG
jgi:hypothetical protein